MIPEIGGIFLITLLPGIIMLNNRKNPIVLEDVL